jgi:predicted membrane protein
MRSLGRSFTNNLGVYMITFVLVMMLLSYFLNSQPFFNQSLLYQRLLIFSFAGGEIAFIIVGIYFYLKFRAIIIRRSR